jgi:papain like cysteine protease AvrRpt2
MADVIRFAQEGQLQTQWCWAAVATSTSLCYDPASAWTQCRVADAVLSVNGCCGHSAACNKPSSLAVALRHTGNQQAGSPVAGPISAGALRGEVDASRPVPIRVLNADGTTAHFMVITGYDDRPDGDIDLRIQDPWGPQLVTVTYSALVSGQFGRPWTHTYLTL